MKEISFETKKYNQLLNLINSNFKKKVLKTPELNFF